MKFPLNKSNRELISWFGGGAVIVISGAWTLFTYLHDDKKPAVPAAPAMVVNSGGGAVVALGGIINGPVNMFDEEKIREQLDARFGPLEKQVEKLNREKGVPLPLLEGLLAKMHVSGTTLENAPAKLNEAADNYEKVSKQLAWIRQNYPELVADAERAQDLLDTGNLNALSRVIELMIQQNKDYQGTTSEAQKQQMARWKILQDTQTQILSIQRDTVEPSSDAYKKWGQFMRNGEE